MELKNWCPNFNWAVIGICVLLLTGCATRTPRPLPPPVTPTVSQPQPPKETMREPSTQPAAKPPVREPLRPQAEKHPQPPVNKPSPMALAALELSDQGRAHLKNGKPDEAIRVLERAINLHPQNGENYYYLSEAWILKGNASQAREFNHLAAIYLKTDPEWVRRVQSQAARIDQMK